VYNGNHVEILDGEKVCKMEITWRYLMVKKRVNGNHMEILDGEKACKMEITWRFLMVKKRVKWKSRGDT
jgi:hypothetical protein